MYIAIDTCSLVATTDVPVEGDEEEIDEEDQLGDLLACLGEEEQKVQILERKLLELGFDPAPLLMDLGVPDEGDGDDFT